MAANPYRDYPADGVPPLGTQHPSIHPDYPTKVDTDGRFNPNTAREQRHASGGLEDDPTESGEPVKDRVSFKNLTGGR